MKKRYFGLLPLLLVWVGLTLFAWFKPSDAESLSERRPLTQFPELSAESLLSGEFMEEFGSYALDQFPLRDSFRQLKAVISRNFLGQKDNNSIYIADGSAAKMDYPLSESSVAHAVDRFNQLYELYFSENETVVFAVVPDKGYYLAESSGHLAMDYAALFSAMELGLPWATHVDLTGALTADSYYRTDTHWRQEALLPAAGVLGNALGCQPLTQEQASVQTLDMDFYGVYFGQAALPMEPDALRYLTWEGWEDCTVFCHDNGKTTQIYDLEKAGGKDPYDIFLSGGVAVQTITNPAGTPGRSLVVFRDSFGSGMIPLLVRDYETVTLVDTRYIFPDQVGNYVNFEDADILLLYSATVLNSSSILRK